MIPVFFVKETPNYSGLFEVTLSDQLITLHHSTKLKKNMMTMFKFKSRTFKFSFSYQYILNRISKNERKLNCLVPFMVVLFADRVHWVDGSLLCLLLTLI